MGLFLSGFCLSVCFGQLFHGVVSLALFPFRASVGWRVLVGGLNPVSCLCLPGIVLAELQELLCYREREREILHHDDQVTD